MKKFRKILLSALSLVLVVALTIVGTVAFLQDEDGEVNVMTVGNVYIEQLEEEWNNGELQDFTQAKPLYPVPNTELVDATGATVVAGYEKYPVINEKNVVDKYVSIKNIGKSEAYVRTVFAFEMGSVELDRFLEIFVASRNETDYTWSDGIVIEVGGVNYYCVVATYNSILGARRTTNPSLYQVFLKSFANNADCVALDGNKNGAVDILTMSQAVQTIGFKDQTATYALNAAFGAITTLTHPWTNVAPEFKTTVSNEEELVNALYAGGLIYLSNDVDVQGLEIIVPEGVTAVLNLNGYEITSSVPKATGHVLRNYGDLTIQGGTISSVADNGGSALYNAKDATLNVVNMTVNGAPRVDGGWPSYAINNYGTLVVDDSTVTGNHGAIAGSNGSTTTLNNVDATHLGWGSSGHVIYLAGSENTVVINGGNYHNNGNVDGSVVAGGSGNTVIINDGVFTAANGGYGPSVGAGTTMYINGGIFKTSSLLDWGGDFVITGGTFPFKPATEYISDDNGNEIAVIKDNGDKTYTVYPINDTWDGSTDTTWYDGVQRTASADNQYYIYTAEQLAGLAKLVNEYGVSFANSTITLMVNVDLQNKDWTPIGYNKGFVGTHPSANYAVFDGNGKVVSNLNVNVKENAGLFGVATYVIIKNVNIVNAALVSNHFAGAVLAQGYARVENCTVENANVAVTPELIDGEWDNGDKVGGVVGKISESNNDSTIYGVYNCTIKNSTVKAYRDVAGILGFAGSYCYVQDNNVVNTTVSQDLSHDYKNFGENNPSANVSAVVGDSTRQPGVTVKNNKVNGIEAIVGSNELVENLENGKDVTFSEDVKIEPAGMSNAYGTTGINVKNGQTIDGNGFVLDIKGAGGTWDSGISTTGGLIKNITVTGSFRGIFINHNSDHSEKVILENVIIDGTTYTISCDQGTGKGLLATNCTFNGWTSYAATLGEAKFVGCSFGEGNGYAFCRPYAPTTFVNCNFEEGFVMDPRAEVTLVNCYLNGVLITEENYEELVAYNADNVKFPAKAESQDELNAQIKAPGAIVALPEGNVTLSGIGAGATIIGSEDTVVNSTVSGTLNNTTFVDVTIKAANAQRWAYASGDLVFDGCTFDASSVYAIHYDGLTNATLVYRNCTIIGWAAIGGGADSIVFENCKIIGNGTYGLVRVYGNATFRNCEFDVVGKTNPNDVYQDGIHAVGSTVIVENCTNVAGNIEDICNVSSGGNIIIK